MRAPLKPVLPKPAKTRYTALSECTLPALHQRHSSPPPAQPPATAFLSRLRQNYCPSQPHASSARRCLTPTPPEPAYTRSAPQARTRSRSEWRGVEQHNEETLPFLCCFIPCCLSFSSRRVPQHFPSVLHGVSSLAIPFVHLELYIEQSKLNAVFCSHEPHVSHQALAPPNYSPAASTSALSYSII